MSSLPIEPESLLGSAEVKLRSLLRTDTRCAFLPDDASGKYPILNRLLGLMFLPRRGSVFMT
jgi:hypothetical protein